MTCVVIADGGVGAAAAGDPALALARDAVDALAARTDGVLRFVESYRDFAFSPQLRRRAFAGSEWAASIRARSSTASGPGSSRRTTTGP